MKKILARYVVIVYVNGEMVSHYASSYADALEWMACYPKTDNPHVYESFLGIKAKNPVAARWDAKGYSYA